MSEINKGFSLWTLSKFFMNGCCSCFNSHFDHHGRFVHFWGAQIILAISLSGNLWAKRCWTKKTLLGPRGPSTRNWPSTLKEILPAAPRCILKVTGGQDRCQNDSFVKLCLASISVCNSLNKCSWIGLDLQLADYFLSNKCRLFAHSTWLTIRISYN